MAIKLGITGGMGSGKSVVAQLLMVMGIPVYISDLEAKCLTNTDPAIRQALCTLLGDALYSDGVLNKAWLASYLFGGPDQARVINGIIHPRVKEHFRWWLSERSSMPIVAMESAILYESGFADEVDLVVMVYAPLEVRVARSMKRDSATREQVLKRMESQMPDEEKRLKAQFTLMNDGEEPLIPQVLKLISFLSENNHYLCPAKKITT